MVIVIAYRPAFLRQGRSKAGFHKLFFSPNFLECSGICQQSGVVSDAEMSGAGQKRLLAGFDIPADLMVSGVLSKPFSRSRRAAGTG